MRSLFLVRLPIDAHLRAIRDALVRRRAVVITAAPGAGKTTRVPPALVDDGPVIVLQPRRVAARAIARRIAEERGWTVGREVGWHVRADRRVSSDTRLTIATEGVLTAKLHQDPLLSEYRTVVLDEFHERSVHADLGLALARQAWLARDDLRLVVMSATIDHARVAAFLDDCPVVEVPGRQFPIEVSYHPGLGVAAAVREAAGRGGAVLCFLPGAAEIARAARELSSLPWPVWPLHGGLDAEAQDAALRPSPDPRVVLATNLAETTVTVPDVTAVVDAGFQKVARYDAGRGVDLLVTERIPQDAADQRAGRAGRTQAGRVWRLWDARDRLRAHREPEILRVDLAGPVLDVLAWGGDPRSFAWFEAPPVWAVDAAMELLARLGAVDRSGRLTEDGRQMRRLPFHPRLARLYLSAQRSPAAERICTALSDGERMPPASAAQTRESDLFVFAERAIAAGDDAELRRAILAAYPDRVARRRVPGREGFLLATGTGAVLGRESGVRLADYIVAVDVTGGGAANADALIRLASAVDAAWLTPTSVDVVHEFDAASGRVRARRMERYGAVVLREMPVAPDPEAAAAMLRDVWTRRGPDAPTLRFLRRLRFAEVDVDESTLLEQAVAGAMCLADVDLAAALPGHVRVQLDARAPETLRVPSGREMPIDYREDGTVLVSVKLQEVFGLADTPRLGPGAVPVTFELLAPNQRPVQVTRDLRSFWARGYPEVRRELRGRYPKHPWPEDPWTATPTHRTRRRC